MNILEQADKYAEGKANEAITKAIVEAYIEGYKAGYKNREEEIPLELRDNKTEYVDLGLPSGLKWATCNVGATSPEQAGLYFAWGETTGYTAEQVKSGVRKFDSASYTASAISTNLKPEQDAAHVNLGGNWRMPASSEYRELLKNCDAVWTADYNGTGVAGRVFTSKVNGNSVFFPAAGYCGDSSAGSVGSDGYYWSTSWYSSSRAWDLGFHSGGQDLYNGSRYCGYSVRGVCE